MIRLIMCGLTLVALAGVVGCASENDKNKNKDFFTSGSREADQRAEQRMAKTQQERGETQKGTDNKGDTKPALYERLGGQTGLQQIADDFMPRVLADPRVNWERKGVTQGGFSLERNKSVEWKATPANVAQLKKHLVQFLSVATGGPPQYDGKEMKQAHAGLHISNTEFDAAVGDLKASLDKIGVKTDEQKELLAIIESTRNQVVTER